MKVITCPYCGKVVGTFGIGRAATKLVVNNICDALQLHGSANMAANALGCSRAYIYQVLKRYGLTPAEVIKGLATKDTRLLHKGAVNGRREE